MRQSLMGLPGKNLRFLHLLPTNPTKTKSSGKQIKSVFSLFFDSNHRHVDWKVTRLVPVYFLFSRGLLRVQQEKIHGETPPPHV